jgi:hypothetical protein
MLEIVNLKKERFILTPGFRDFNPWFHGPTPLALVPWHCSTSWWECMTENTVHLMVARKQRERERKRERERMRSQYLHQRDASNEPTSTRPFLLKFPLPSSLGDLGF